MAVQQIRKRDGRIVPFDRNRIERAITKAYKATGVAIDNARVIEITNDVIADTEDRFVDILPGVESIQDIVERKIAEKGDFEVAKSYILYRLEHQMRREHEQQQVQVKAEKHEITVKKRNGTREPFDMGEIDRLLGRISQDFKQVNFEVIKNSLSVYDGMETRDISTALVMATRAHVERDPEYSLLAARVLFNGLYKDIFSVDELDDHFEEAYRRGFKTQIEKAVNDGRLDKRLLEFDLTAMAENLRPERDRLFKYLGAQTLYDRYFLKDYDQNILEAPQYFWMRVAMGIALDEKREDWETWAIKFYETVSQMRYVPSTPTLFHAGTNHPQMSSCYLTTVQDNLVDIFKSYADNAQLSKWSGGLGNDWTNIRGTGSLIKTTNVSSQGVIPFLKISDSTTAAINRSGKRRGATCVYLETWHYDFESFLELRKNTGDERRRTHDTNTANWIPDLFMKRVAEDGQWTLFSPDETPDLHHIYGQEFETRYLEYEQKAERGEMQLFKKLRAKDLWRKMITILFETGHPWMTFKDPCNVRSPQDHVGVVHSSNLCTEITLNTSKDETAVCNLGSVNLPNHIKDGQLDKEHLAETVKIAMRMLDNVISLCFYPTIEAKNSNLKHRPVGLGVMGLQDAFYDLGLAYDSEEAVRFSDEVQEILSYHAILSSSELAREKGAYGSFQGSKWDRGIFPYDTVALLEKERGQSTETDMRMSLDWTPVKDHVRQHGMRNSNCMAIAPTATIANISGCLPSVEPIYKNIYAKSNFSGEFTVVNDELIEELKKLNLWGEEMLAKIKNNEGSIQEIDEIPMPVRAKYKEVFEIDTIWIIRHAAQRGKWIDQSQSINIFTSSTSGTYISELYMAAWKAGLKTTYYLRSLGASGIESSTVDINKYGDKNRETKKGETGATNVTAPTSVETPAPVAGVMPVPSTNPSAPALTPSAAGDQKVPASPDVSAPSPIPLANTDKQPVMAAPSAPPPLTTGFDNSAKAAGAQIAATINPATVKTAPAEIIGETCEACQ